MTTVTDLAADEQAALRAYESTIAAGLATFVAVGRCLAAIRDGKLYRGTHTSFEAYCVDRWKVTRPRAYQLIEAAGVADEMSKIFDIAPMTESHAAALAAAPPEARPEVWKQAVQGAPRDRAGKPKVTASSVRKEVAKRQALHASRPATAAAAAALAPPAAKVGLNDAVRALRRTVQQSGDATAALQDVQAAVSRGLYGPGQDAQAAFRELLDVVGMLLERRS